MALCENPEGCDNTASYWVFISGNGKRPNLEVAACHTCLSEAYEAAFPLSDGLGLFYRKIGDKMGLREYYHYDDKVTNIDAIREHARECARNDRGPEPSVIHFHKHGAPCEGEKHEQFEITTD
jgi:hypothetical protein